MNLIVVYPDRVEFAWIATGDSVALLPGYKVSQQYMTSNGYVIVFEA